MKDAMEFEMLRDDVLREVANPDPEKGLEQRLIRRMEMAAGEVQALGLEEAELASLDGGVVVEGVFRSLWSSLRELVAPVKLPPLVLESRPVVVVDRMAGGRSYRPAAWAVAAHAFAILVIGYAATTRIVVPNRIRTTP